jgi:catechol 2,3-dioxygenase-like lactoylglutathione lyase family enzyme
MSSPGVMIDHIGFGVGDYARAKDFYTKVFRALGGDFVFEVPPEVNPTGRAAGFGRDNKPSFWIGEEGAAKPPMHVAFLARTRAEVHAFYETALAEGASDNGAPGLRPHYHENYYSAFVRDFDGHNIEAVCHLPEELGGK